MDVHASSSGSGLVCHMLFLRLLHAQCAQTGSVLTDSGEILLDPSAADELHMLHRLLHNCFLQPPWRSTDMVQLPVANEVQQLREKMA